MTKYLSFPTGIYINWLDSSPTVRSLLDLCDSNVRPEINLENYRRAIHSRGYKTDGKLRPLTAWIATDQIKDRYPEKVIGVNYSTRNPREIKMGCAKITNYSGRIEYQPIHLMIDSFGSDRQKEEMNQSVAEITKRTIHDVNNGSAFFDLNDILKAGNLDIDDEIYRKIILGKCGRVGQRWLDKNYPKGE